MATIYDVAKAAGVSVKTVSRVLNGDAPVKAQTRDAVKAAIAELDYIRSSAAQSMRSQRTGLVGLITGAISLSPGVAELSGLPDIFIVQGAQKHFSAAGKTVLIADTGGDESAVPGLVHTFLEHRVEGILYVAAHHRQVQLPAVLQGRPLVLANCFDDRGTPAILPDDEMGQYDLVTGLIERGHRRIGFLTVAESQVAHPLRLAGYRRALQENGITYDPALVATAEDKNSKNDFDQLTEALGRLLGLATPPSAICCGNDSMAMRVYTLLSQRGVSIPEQISVAGYDDYYLITEHLSPTLTSVRLPYRTIGARAAERLLGLISGAPETEPPASELVCGPVTWRQSAVEFDPTIQNTGRKQT